MKVSLLGKLSSLRIMKQQESDSIKQHHHKIIPTAQIVPKKKHKSFSDVIHLKKRNLDFWSRSMQIYFSYKTFQMKNALLKRLNINNYDEEEGWKALHEKNSQRMIDLCLHLRGFYLKTGQFLGSRHDFMPREYTSKLSILHDSIPPMNETQVRKLIKRELNTTSLANYFTWIDLTQPIGSASIAQVHKGMWKATNQMVAIKIQNPESEKLMIHDLNNLHKLGSYLQKHELKVDLVSAITELRNQIKHEFNFCFEANYLQTIGKSLQKEFPKIHIPNAILATRRLLVMSFVEGNNLSKFTRLSPNSIVSSSFPSSKALSSSNKSWFTKALGHHFLRTLAKVWGYQIFVLGTFHADPHPGNICIHPKTHAIGILDWGQMKTLTPFMQRQFRDMISALHTRNSTAIMQAFHAMNIQVANSNDIESIEKLAVTMFDTRSDAKKYVLDPFHPNAIIKTNRVITMPSDWFFILRTVQLFRGMAYVLGDTQFSLADEWMPYAAQVKI